MKNFKNYIENELPGFNHPAFNPGYFEMSFNVFNAGLSLGVNNSKLIENLAWLTNHPKGTKLSNINKVTLYL